MINAEGWIDQWPDHPTIRRFDPPRDVLVDMASPSVSHGPVNEQTA